MVIEDFRTPPIESKPESPSPKQPGVEAKKNSELRLGAPTDRLAAVLADMILLVPVISLTTAPFRKQLSIAQILRDSDGLMAASVSMVFAAILTVTLYQTLFLVLFSATPGKRLFHLRVVSIWPGQSRLLPSQMIFRSLAWCVEALMFCLPWISALTNPGRRAWHDRLTDTQVVSTLSDRSVGAPDLREQALGRSIQSGILAAFLGFTFVSLLQHPPQNSSSQSASILTRNPFLCSAVSEAQREWMSQEAESRGTRIEIALALYAAGSIHENCLRVEAEAELWGEKASPLAYLAKGLSFEDSDVKDAAHKKQAYFEKVCQLDQSGASCDLVRAFYADGRLASEQILARISNHLNAKNAPAYLQIYLIKKLLESGRFESALKWIEQGSAHKRLGFFFANARLKSLWGLRRISEARLAMLASLDGFEADERLRLTKVACQSELSFTCDQGAKTTCALFDRAVRSAPDELDDDRVALSWIKGQECVTGNSPDYQEMKSWVRADHTQAYFQGLINLKNQHPTKARRSFELVLDSPLAGAAMVAEAQRNLIELASNERDLDVVVKSWLANEMSAEDPSETDAFMANGYALLKRFDSFQGPSQDENERMKRKVEVASRIVEFRPKDYHLKRMLVVWAYQSGDLKQAKSLYQRLTTEAGAARGLASVAQDAGSSDFAQVAKELGQIKPTDSAQERP